MKTNASTLVPIIITERKTDNIWVNGDPQKIARSQPQFREVNESLQDCCVGVGRVWKSTVYPKRAGLNKITFSSHGVSSQSLVRSYVLIPPMFILFISSTLPSSPPTLLPASVQFSSVKPLGRLWLCNPMDCSTPGFPVHHQLPELAQTHIHWVGDAIQPTGYSLRPLPSSDPCIGAPAGPQHSLAY